MEYPQSKFPIGSPGLYIFFCVKVGNTGINIMNRTEPGWRIERKQTQKLVEVKDRSSTIDNSPKNK